MAKLEDFSPTMTVLPPILRGKSAAIFLMIAAADLLAGNWQPLLQSLRQKPFYLFAAPRSLTLAENASFAKAAAAPGLPAVWVSIQRRFSCFRRFFAAFQRHTPVFPPLTAATILP
jgi:hypothetical protein